VEGAAHAASRRGTGEGRRRAGGVEGGGVEAEAGALEIGAAWRPMPAGGARGRRDGAGVDGGGVEGGRRRDGVAVDDQAQRGRRKIGRGGRGGCVAEVDDRALERKQSGRKKNRALYPGP